MLNTKSKRNQQKQIIAALTGKTLPASLELSPNDTEAHNAHALFLMAVHRDIKGAIEHWEFAAERDRDDRVGSEQAGKSWRACARGFSGS